MARIILFSIPAFVSLVIIGNGGKECDMKSAKLAKLMKKVEKEREARKTPKDLPFSNKFIDFLEDKGAVDITNSVMQNRISECPERDEPLPIELSQSCQQFHKESFAKEPSILISFHKGRLGNQMSSFSTILGLNLLSGGKFRIGLTNYQQMILSATFPYFEQNIGQHCIEAMYCTKICEQIKWKHLSIDMYDAQMDTFRYIMDELSKNNSFGDGINIGEYINVPMLYKPHLEELQTKYFALRQNLKDRAKDIIKAHKKKLGRNPDAIIGIHGRYTDYDGHLILRGRQLIGTKFYRKAIKYFREKYEHPLFLVTSDAEGKAKAFIVNSEKEKGDIFFAGTISQAKDEKITAQESVGIDLALLSMCDHLIISHGTFGLWGAFLASTNNTHIMAHDMKKSQSGSYNPLNRFSQQEVEEIRAVKKANLTNFIFMDDI